MKKRWLTYYVLLNGLFFSTVSAANTNAELMLRQMQKASVTLNYEMDYINITGNGIESLRYRHAFTGKHNIAQLLLLDGPVREVLLRDNEISYFFEPGHEPFSITGDHIIDALPAIVSVNFERLASYYNFIPIGRARIANHLCYTIRVSAKDGMRYGYELWLDEKTKLPLQIELRDPNGEILEQFRVLSMILSNDIHDELLSLDTKIHPPKLSLPQNEKIALNWRVNWLPFGFKEVSSGRKMLPVIQQQADSRLFSDGLFSFTVNVLPLDEVTQSTYSLQGRRSIHSERRDNYEIIIVGELPLNTAQRILNSIVFDVEK